MNSYSFDVELTAAVTVNATSEEHARAILRETLDCADCNGGPVLFEASLTGTPELYAVNDEEL